MASDMRVSSRTIGDMVKVDLSGQMAGFMMVAGKQASNMAMAYLLHKMELRNEVNGRMARGSSGCQSKFVFNKVSQKSLKFQTGHREFKILAKS